MRMETCEKFQQSLVLPLLPLPLLQLLHRPLDVPLADVKEHLQVTLAVKTNMELGIELDCNLPNYSDTGL